MAKRTSNQKSDRASRRTKKPVRQGNTLFSRYPFLPDVLICLGILCILIFVFRGYIIDGKTDASPDTISQAAPFNKFSSTVTTEYNEKPLWIPHIFSGMPFQASGTIHDQYTFETLMRAILPTGLFNALYGRITLHLLLGGVSMFLLARALSLSRLAGLVAALIFLFNAHVMGTDHVNRIACFMHIPLVFFAAYRLFETRQWIYMILLGGAFGSQLGSFHPQIAHYTGMMVGLYFVYTIINDLRDGKGLQPVLMNTGMFAGALALAGMMAAILILPMQEYAEYSARNLAVGGSAVNVPFATSWSFPPMEILTFIIPSFAGFGGQTYWGAMPFTDYPNYLGVVSVLLAGLGFAYNRNRLTIFLVILTVAALLVSFGRHLPPVSYLMLNFMPYFAKFRVPVMILILLQFAVALLAAYGVQALVDPVKSRITALLKPLTLAAAGLFALVFLLTLAESSFQSAMTGLYQQADSTHGARQGLVANTNLHAQINALRFDMLMNDLWILVVVFAVAVGLIYLFLSQKIGIVLFSTGLVLLVLIDLLRTSDRLVDPQYEKGIPSAYYQKKAGDPVIKALQQDNSLFRIFPIDEFTTNEYTYFGFSSIGGYHAAKLGIYQEMIDHVGFGSFAVLNMLNTKYLVSKQPLTGALLRPIIESEDGYLYQNVTALPRAYMVDSLKVITDKQAIFEELKSPLFNPAKYAILEKDIGTTLGPVDSASVQITNYTPHRIDIMVDTPASGLLVLSEVYYPAGWEAIIDGEPAEILKTNYILRSLVVPAGRHDITLTFQPSTFTIGNTLSRVSSMLILVVLIGAGGWRLRKNMTKNTGQTDTADR